MSNEPISINRNKARDAAALREKYLSESMVNILRDLLWSWRTPKPPED